MSTPIKTKSPGFGGRISLVFTSRVWVWSAFSAFIASVLSCTIQMATQIKLTGSNTSPILLFGGLFAVSVFACASVLLTKQWHARFSFDHDLNGVQKLHQVAVPRIGGLPIFLSVSVGVAWMWFSEHPLFEVNLLMLVCGLPVFMIGFAEDITKKVSVKLRLQATSMSTHGLPPMGTKFTSCSRSVVLRWVGTGWHIPCILVKASSSRPSF